MPFGMPSSARPRTAARSRFAMLATPLAVVAIAASALTASPDAAAAATTTAPSAAHTGAGILRVAPTKVVEGDVVLTGNQSLKDTIVHGRIVVKGTNNVVENDIVTARAGATYRSASSLVDTQWATNADVHYNTIRSTATSPYVNGIGPRNVRAERNHISRVIDGVDMAPVNSDGALNSTIEYNFIHDLTFYGKAPDHGPT